MPTGLTFPIQLNRSNGSLKLSSDRQRIQEQILEILSTKFLERVMIPSFGNDEFIFTAISNVNIISTKIKFSLDTFLTENIFTKVTTKQFKNGKIEIIIEWYDRNAPQLKGQLSKSFNL